MLNKSDIREVTFEDLQALKENQISESHTLDYKRDFPFEKDGRVKLAADVVAFANTRGGDLILGAEEREGVISNFVPVPLPDRDEALLTLQSALTDLIEPKIPGLRLFAVPFPDGGYIVVVRTPASFQAPHRVTKGGVFYTRTSTGIDPMDITTLRSAFLQSATAAEKAKHFRESRIADIRRHPTPARLPAETLAILHVIPMASVLGAVTFDAESLYVVAQDVAPLMSEGRSVRVNFDGAVSFYGTREECFSYTQLFRNGCFESVMPIQLAGDDVAWVSQFEAQLESHHEQLRKACRKLGLDGPAFVAMSFVDIGGRPLERAGSAMSAISGVAKVPAFYKNLLLPEELVESFGSCSPDLYGPMFDMVWNTAGRQKRPARR
jgi:hypothetical protein